MTKLRKKSLLLVLKQERMAQASKTEKYTILAKTNKLTHTKLHRVSLSSPPDKIFDKLE